MPDPSSSARPIWRKNLPMTGFLGNGVKQAGSSRPNPWGLLLFSVRACPYSMMNFAGVLHAQHKRTAVPVQERTYGLIDVPAELISACFELAGQPFALFDQFPQLVFTHVHIQNLIFFHLLHMRVCPAFKTLKMDAFRPAKPAIHLGWHWSERPD